MPRHIARKCEPLRGIFEKVQTTHTTLEGVNRLDLFLGGANQLA